jgi:hypothetical protein
MQQVKGGACILTRHTTQIVVILQVRQCFWQALSYEKIAQSLEAARTCRQQLRSHYSVVASIGKWKH